MLVIREAGLVILEVPKTGTQALRAMLGRQADVAYGGAARHIGAGAYAGRHAATLAAEIGRVAETVAVVRAPIDRLASWHRFLQRDRVAGGPRSTAGISFDDFVQATLMPKPPHFADVGRQDRQVGWTGIGAAVDHLFDYDRLDLLVDFLAERVALTRGLKERNASPRVETGPLSAATEVLLRTRNVGEFALHAAVAVQGYLRKV